ncbi:MAG: hypothetical protein WCF27_11450 [Gaiellaceae bacterium]
MRIARFVVLVCLGAGLASSVPALGLSRSAPGFTSAQQACGRVEFVSGLEAVFGRRKTHQQALTFRTQVTGRGFVNANIIEGCDGFRVVVRGIDTFDVGVDLQSEARREGFAVTLECIQAKQIGRWDGVLGHGRDRVAATAIADRAESVGFPGAKLRNDPCGGFEVYVPGFADQAEAASWAEAARARGFPQATAELS